MFFVLGGILVVITSDGWFPGKQIFPWADLHPFERQGLVLDYFLREKGSWSYTLSHFAAIPDLPKINIAIKWHCLTLYLSFREENSEVGESPEIVIEATMN